MLQRRPYAKVITTLLLLVLSFFTFSRFFTQRQLGLRTAEPTASDAAFPATASASGSPSRLVSQDPSSRKQAPSSLPAANQDNVDWSQFAYVLHATSSHYLCNSVMIIERLQAVGAKADRVLLYPNDLALDETDRQGALLIKARDKYGAIVKPVEVLRKDSAEATWSAGHTKFLAFNETSYTRVLHLDSDATVLQSMDELFLLPPSPVALPRAYWLDQTPKAILSAQLILITPSEHELNRILAQSENSTANEYDMEMVNALYRDTAMVLPFWEYDLLTGEFRAKEHSKYLGGDKEATWDPDQALKRGKYVHFSDWPVPKPWMECSSHVWEAQMPRCYDERGVQLNETDVGLCRDREIWVGFYTDFKKRRLDVCGAGFYEGHGE